jgi:HEAT repeat protein
MGEQGAAMARVYISSTYDDLREHREKVYRVLRQLGQDVVAMEDYVAADQRPLDKCLADVAACNLYVGIFAHRYGYVPEHGNPGGCSITELEYRHAGDMGIPRLVFLLDVKTAWPPERMDVFTGEGEQGARIRELRAELGRECLASFFSNADELAQKVSVAASNQLAVGTGDAAEYGDLAALDLASYFKRLEQQYARLDLNALTPPQREEYLQILLRSVFVEQQVRAEPPPVELPKMTWDLLRSKGELGGEDRYASLGLPELYRQREVYQRKPARPVLDVLTERGNRLVTLLGDPGAGKSTLARYLLLCVVEGAGDPRLGAALEQHLPLLIELRAYAGLRAQGKCDTFLGFLGYLGRTEGYGLTEQGLDSYLRRGGRALVIFDGLDELFDPAERETVSRQIAGFAASYEHVRAVVTSRIIGYRRETLDAAGFSHYTLQDLDRPQIECFISNWYELAFHQQPEEAEPRRRRLATAVEDSQSIRELAGNPLLLTILAIIGKHQDLPRERWKLYDHAAGVLVEHWDVNKHLADARIDADFIGEDDKKELLRRVALRMQGGSGGLVGNYLPADELQSEFEDYLATRYGRDPAAAKVIAQGMIRQFRERNFVLSSYGAGLYGFVHRAFLEYFCATALVRSFEKSRQLTLDQLKTDVFGRHWEDETWREVLRLIAGMLDERFTAELLDFLIDVYGPWPARCGKRPPRNLILATGCLAEVRNLAAVRPQAERLLRAVTDLVEHLTRRRDFEGAGIVEKSLLPAVAAVGPRWPGRELFHERFRAKGPRVTQALGILNVGRLLGALFSDSEDVRQELYALATTAPSGGRRATALAGLVQGWPDHPKTRPLVVKCAVHDTDNIVRREAVHLLSEGWRRSPETLTLLRERFVSEPDEYLSPYIANVIGEGWPHDPDTLAMLRERIRDSDDQNRGELLAALAVGWHDDPQTLPLLIDRARNDPDGFARGLVLDAIAVGWPDDPQTLPVLYERARNDPEGFARGSALGAIAAGWPDDPETLPLLLDRAVSDPNEFARGPALRAIAVGWPDDPQTLPLLQGRARDDPDNFARSSALEAIAVGWPDDPQTLPLLLDHARNHSEKSALGSVLRAIVAGWPDDPQTLPLLLDHACNDPNNFARSSALEAIAVGWPDDPQTLPLFLDRVRNDSDNFARSSALLAIAAGWPDDPQVLPLLHERAHNDPSDFTRADALGAIAAGWPDDPQTLRLLHERARSDPGRYGTVQLRALRVLAILSPTPDLGSVARGLLADDLLTANRRALRRLIATVWAEE